ncbi:MAG: cation:proton antiporter [Haliangiales bacterium]
MHLDPAMPPLVAAIFVVLTAAMLLKTIKQPYVIAYIVAGVVIGPDGIGLVVERASIDRLGAFGIVFLLFFVGMEVSPHRLLANWRVPVIGTLLQIAASIGCVALLGALLDWPLNRIVLVGFIISLSSTAVVLKILEDRNELETDTGADVLGVLLVQDILVVPMLVVIGLLSGDGASTTHLVLQGIGGALMVAMTAALVIRKRWRLPFANRLRVDHELQVFAALAICFGFALISGLFELSAALGAFFAGMLIGATKETEWVHHSLHPFRVVFVSLFFLSVGMLVDLQFLLAELPTVLGIVLAAVVTNTVVNGLSFLALGESRRSSLYGGALLSQIGEFSFILAAMGLAAGIVDELGYQLAIAAICVSLIVSPAWISTVRVLVGRR